ncbi:N-acetyllactosaminide beta-1,3-N-acetylglucosaminyltransferase 2 [Genypterus blacodes]|uniref:N-acetyllactosaminide beta-1,3-N-acetylglucosaminyltransferase 2 n=1 Tax=Genypterus blacodes TaxID=154954 RepID=UPI003F76DA82
MKYIQTYVALTLLGSLFLIFLFSTLHTDMAYSHKALPEDSRRHLTSLGRNSTAAATRPPQQSTPQVQIRTTAASITPPPQLIKVPHNPAPRCNVSVSVSVSYGLREQIPHNKAYWNRLLYSALGSVNDGKYTFKCDVGVSDCQESDHELLQTNVHDFNSYPQLFGEFLRRIGCRSPPILIDQPNKCPPGPGDTEDGTFLLFAIKSNPEHFVQRQAVRETWGQERVYQSGLRVRTVFLLGSSSLDLPDLSLLLSFESKQFGDILQWDFHESLLNLTLKANVFLRWATRNCPDVSFVFSGDDDVFVNTPAVLDYLKSLDPAKAAQSYVGHIISTAAPLRDQKSKYYVPLSFYEGPYPAYAGGGGFVISGPLLEPLYYISHILPFFPIDDVYIGMCFKALGVTPEAHSSFHTFDVQEQDREDLCLHKSLFLIHQRNPYQLKKLWRGIHSPLLTC